MIEQDLWQPIETAPRDGTYVLVYPPIWGGPTCSIAQFDNDGFARKPRPFWYRIDADSQTRSREKPPTHWQPMPAPPGTSKP